MPKEEEESIPIQQVWNRNCDKETAQPREGQIKGSLPSWLSGRLTRNGPGRVKYGKTTYNHLFDGNAVLHQFNIDDGKVTYISKYLQSDTHKRNSKANRIVIGEFGTAAHPDPCKTLLQRFMSMFEGPGSREVTDNCVVNVCHFGDELYALTETNNLRRIDPNTLDCIGEKTCLMNYIAVNTATAHPHIDPDGTVYNMGNFFAGKKGPCYNIIKFPPPKVVDGKKISSVEQATIVSQIPCQWKLAPSYYHSFGITDDYFVFVEQPFVLSLKKVFINHYTNKPYLGAVEYYPDKQVKFRIVHRSTGKQLEVEYGTEAFVTFHHVNAFVKDDQMVVDLCAIPDGSVIQSAMLEELKNPNYFVIPETLPLVRRYIMPLNVKDAPLDTNLVTLKDNPKCSAFKRSDGSIELVGQTINETHLDLPRINYKNNGKEYRYTYGVEVNPKGIEFSGLLKFDMITGEAWKWTEPNKMVSEPVFVPSPDATKEDDGVCLSSLIDKDDPHYVSLLVLNAETWKEEARVEFKADGIVTGTFHGQFAAKNDMVHVY
ncbi:unnamed protein product [Meganyctiphanes norvegica]|uniref:Uncharacterized protein n=1 Tax=Meganyctiphanes norvegica TaxID=48144 RepID=A0AAV2QEK6_MEGNR